MQTRLAGFDATPLGPRRHPERALRVGGERELRGAALAPPPAGGLTGAEMRADRAAASVPPPAAYRFRWG